MYKYEKAGTVDKHSYHIQPHKRARSCYISLKWTSSITLVSVSKEHGHTVDDFVGRLQLKCDGTRWRREGKWRGNWRMEWVASTLHTTSEHGVSSITTADAHNSAASSRLNWRSRRFKWTRPFRRKMKPGFARVPSHFNWSLQIPCGQNRSERWQRAA